MNDYEELLLKSFLAGLGRWRAVSAPGRCVSLLAILPVMVSMRVVECAFVRAVVCALYCSPWGGLRRARAVLRASRVMREAVRARVRRSASFAPFPYRV